MYHESVLVPEDWEVFAEYGHTMLLMQEMERSLLATVNDDVLFARTEGLSDEEWREEFFKSLDKLFVMTAGQLKAQLTKKVHAPQELIDEIALIVHKRNKLAHGYLSKYLDERRFENSGVYHDKIAELQELSKHVEDVTRRLDDWSREDMTRERREHFERIERATPEERRRLAQGLYDSALELGETFWSRHFVYDLEQGFFRFPDGQFALSSNDADWQLLEERGYPL